MSGSWGSALLSVGVLARTYGRRGLTRRALHEIRRNRGWFQGTPRPDPTRVVPEGSIFRPRGGWDRVPEERKTLAIERGRKVVTGWYEAYGHEWRRLPADAKGWRTHPGTGYEFSMGPWWTIPLLPPNADIKDVWEPGRFGWVYDLVRAYALSHDETFARAFDERLAAFIDANPPFRGVQWACGQETAIRAIAVLHAQDGLPRPSGGSETAARRITTLLAWSGERIADAIGYGLSQRNNHGISEASGLIQIALRLGDAHPSAGEWLSKGQRFLSEQIRDQFAPDGWYAQHSFTYMRVALEQALHAQRALEAHGLSLPADALRRLDSAVALLVSVVDGRSGVVPNHGANDGARVVPLSTADFRDFRPLLTLASLVRNRPLPTDIPPDSEVLNWLGRESPPPAPARRDGVEVGSSGWAVARVEGASLFIRAGRYSHRPSHIDPLHIDVRFEGMEVITDAGTFAYNAPAPWKNALAAAYLHNGPLLDGIEPAQRGPRFLWYSWPNAGIVDTTYERVTATVIAEAPGRVRRSITVNGSAITVVDHVLAPSASMVGVTWLLHPSVNPNCVEVPDAETVRAKEGDVTAWFSPTYGLRVASIAIRANRPAAPGTELRTVIRRPRAVSPADSASGDSSPESRRD
jgi:hypothetical protein